MVKMKRTLCGKVSYESRRFDPRKRIILDKEKMDKWVFNGLKPNSHKVH